MDKATIRQFYPRMTTAIREGNSAEIDAVLREYPEALNLAIPDGNWLLMAAWSGTEKVVADFVRRGLDPNATDSASGRNALAKAAGKGNLASVSTLAEAGATLDTSQSTGNPLIASINARSVPVAEYLLDAGIDARVDYQMAPGVRYDALCFALEQGAREVANVIALHLAGGDKPGAQAELDRAWAAVKAGNPNAKTWPETPVI